MAAAVANWNTVRLSSGISANILDFGIPQKHVLWDLLAMETGCEAGSRVRRAGWRQKSRRFRQREAGK